MRQRKQVSFHRGELQSQDRQRFRPSASLIMVGLFALALLSGFGLGKIIRLSMAEEAVTATSRHAGLALANVLGMFLGKASGGWRVLMSFGAGMDSRTCDRVCFVSDLRPTQGLVARPASVLGGVAESARRPIGE